MSSEPNMEKLAEYMEKGAKRLDDLESEMKTQGNRLREIEEIRERITPVGGWSKDDSKRPFSLAAVIRGMSSGGLDNAAAWKGFEREREAGIQARERAMGVAPDSAGGYVVPEEYMAELIPLLTAKTAAVQAGATELRGLQGTPVKIPKQTGGVTAQWQTGENTAITASDATLGEIQLAPRMATAMAKMSRRLVALSNPSIEAIVRNDILGGLARLVDLAAFRGTGSNGQPTGIANTASIETITAVGVPTVDDLLEAEYRLRKNNAPMSRVAFVCHPRTWNSLVKQRAGGSTTTDGAYLIQPDPTQAARGTVLGYPVITTTQLPINLGGGTNESVAYFADFSELLIGSWGTMVIEATDSGGDAFAYHQIWTKAVVEMDVAVRHPESFVELSGITA